MILITWMESMDRLDWNLVKFQSEYNTIVLNAKYNWK